MRLIDLYPSKGTYHPGEPISLETLIEADSAAQVELQITIHHLTETLETISMPLRVEPGRLAYRLNVELPLEAPRGYGITAQLLDRGGQASKVVGTAVDVLESWIDFPRYGFLFDFAPGRDVDPPLDWLSRFHINGLQFYDWQHRHDQLLAPTERYVDPLGRELSLATVQRLIKGAQARGMATMAYLAVYAASLTFAETHPGWRLYSAQGEPLNFEGFLDLMDPTPGGPWSEHLLAECSRVMAVLNFDGLHVDQYGEPRVGFDILGTPVDLPTAFAGFISALKEGFPAAPVTFNAVKNWPIETLVNAPLDFTYIELWPDTPGYQDVLEIVQNARMRSRGKPVVVAQYIPTANLANLRLSQALILTLGGSRIELGEERRLLTDPYFPKSEFLHTDLERTLRRTYDFALRYGELIGPTAGTLAADEVAAPEGILVNPRRAGSLTALHLVNFSGLEGTRWSEPHPEPASLKNVPLSFSMGSPLRGAWWTSPDQETLNLEPLRWQEQGGRTHVVVPSLDYWSMVIFETR